VAYDVRIAAPDVTLADVVIPAETGTICNLASANVYMNAALALDRVLNHYTGMAIVNTLQPAIPDPNGSGGDVNDARHPINRMIQVTSILRADIVFATGNCGYTQFPRVWTATG
jgi:hypothetical protein